MQAIQTKTLPLTAKRNRRMKATAQAGSVTIEWNSDLTFEANHKAAAQALATKFGWLGVWIGGFMPDGTGTWVNSSQNTTLNSNDRFAVTDAKP